MMADLPARLSSLALQKIWSIKVALWLEILWLKKPEGTNFWLRKHLSSFDMSDDYLFQKDLH